MAQWLRLWFPMQGVWVQSLVGKLIPHAMWHKPKKFRASLVAQRVKRLPSMQETWVRSLGWEDPLEKGMTTHSSTLAWRIPWMEKPGGLQSIALSLQLYVYPAMSFSVYLCHCNFMYSSPCHFGYFLPRHPRFPAGYSRCFPNLGDQFICTYLRFHLERSHMEFASVRLPWFPVILCRSIHSRPHGFLLSAESLSFTHLKHCSSPLTCTKDIFAFCPLVTVSGGASHVGVHVSVGRVVFSRCSPQKGIPGPHG